MTDQVHGGVPAPMHNLQTFSIGKSFFRAGGSYHSLVRQRCYVANNVSEQLSNFIHLVTIYSYREGPVSSSNQYNYTNTGR